MNDYLAGVAASGVGTCVSHPLDVVKTRVQVHGSTTYHALKITAQKGHFFKGIVPALTGYTPTHALAFGGYGWALTFMESRTAYSGSHSHGEHFLAGFVGGCCYAVGVVPFELVKVRLQVDKEKRYRGMLHCFQSIIAKEGPAAAFNGLGLTLCKEGFGHALYFSSYEYIKVLLFQRNAAKDQHELDHFGSLVSGGLAGIFSYSIIHPFDTLKSMVQSSVGASAQTTSSMLKLLPRLVKTHGIVGMYRGIGPVVILAFPECAAMLYTYELTMHYLDPHAQAMHHQ
jgi:solute carrier family 25 carnitine/acylcarnitine transporter 20/29